MSFWAGDSRTPDVAGRTCPYCGRLIRQGEEVIFCQGCGTAHHDKCWHENGGCTTPDCTFHRALSKVAVVQASPQAQGLTTHTALPEGVPVEKQQGVPGPIGRGAQLPDLSFRLARTWAVGGAIACAIIMYKAGGIAAAIGGLIVGSFAGLVGGTLAGFIVPRSTDRTPDVYDEAPPKDEEDALYRRMTGG